MQPLHQQLQNELFREFEPEEYYQRHFKQGKRTDGRALQESRKVFATIGSFADCPGSCLLRRGGCIIIVQVRATPQELAISPLTNTYSTAPINVETTISERRHTSHLDRIRLQNYLSYSIETTLKQLNLQNELVRKEGYKTYGYVLNISLKVLSDDGALLENCLLCTQFALFSTKLQDFKVEEGKFVNTGSKHLLKPTGFLYPLSHCQLYGQILLDPTSEQQERSSYTLSVLWNLLQPNSYRLHKHGATALEPQVLAKLIDLSRVELSKQKFNLLELQNRLQTISEEFTLELQ